MKDAILPQIDSFIDASTETVLMPSYDWTLDVDNKRVRSEITTDEPDIMQSCYMILSTERGTNPLYPDFYGREFNDLYGKPPDYVCSVLPTRIKEALMVDARIADVVDFEFSTNRGDVLCQFRVELTDEARESFMMEVVM